MDSISEKLQELIEQKDAQEMPKSETDFIQASKEYERLVNEGLVVKRGYNLMTTQEIYESYVIHSHNLL